MKILAIGDSYMPPRYFAEAFAGLEAIHEIDYRQVDQDRSFEPSTPSERKLREYQGAPEEVAAWMDGVEVLVVQGAPVTDAVLGAGSALRARLLRPRRPGQRRRRRRQRARAAAGQHPGQERRGRRRPDAGVRGHAGPRPAPGPALPRGRPPAARQLGGRPVHGQRPAPARPRPGRLRPDRPAGRRAGAALRHAGAGVYDPYVDALGVGRRAGRDARRAPAPGRLRLPARAGDGRQPPPDRRRGARRDEAGGRVPDQHRPRGAGRRARARRRAGLRAPRAAPRSTSSSTAGATAATACCATTTSCSRRTSAGRPTRRCCRAPR